MMNLDNVTPLNSTSFQQKEQNTPSIPEPNNPNTTPALSIDSVLQEMDTWRKNKPNLNELMPDALWEKIFALSNQHSLKRMRSVFGISDKRYQKKYRELHPTESPSPQATPTQKPDIPPIDFCEVKTRNPVFEPLNIPTNTVLVEFARRDGKVMKIHMLSSRLIEIIDAFYVGDTYATNHAKT